MKHLVRFCGLLAFFTLAGCSHQKVPVKGQVTVSGKGPLTGGAIQFSLESNPEIFGSGLIQADGTYEVNEAPVGECKVTINNEHLKVGGKVFGAAVPGHLGGVKSAPPGATSKMNKAPKGVEIPSGGEKGGSVGMKFMKINPDYYKVDTTPLKATVTSGQNTHNFEVK